MKRILADIDPAELKRILTEDIRCEEFRARQLYEHLMRYDDVDGMSDIPLELRREFKRHFIIRAVTIEKKYISADGTVKYLFALSDGNLIEAVLMAHNYGNTLCVFTQVGCRMGCAFCASGKDGLVRSLTAGEILGEVLAVNRDNGGTRKKRAVTNVVLMGSGEPLDNYDEVTRFLRLLTDENGINISERNVSLSTCGLAENIRRLADDGFKVTLSISLHSSDDASRRKIMPIANKYTVSEVVAAARYYFEKTGRRVIFEYTAISGVNTSDADVMRLKGLLRGFPCHVNLIPLNAVKGSSLVPLKDNEIYLFCRRLEAAGVSASVRRTKGTDVAGACGQLRRRYLDETRKENDG